MKCSVNNSRDRRLKSSTVRTLPDKFKRKNLFVSFYQAIFGIINQPLTKCVDCKLYGMRADYVFRNWVLIGHVISVDQVLSCAYLLTLFHFTCITSIATSYKLSSDCKEGPIFKWLVRFGIALYIAYLMSRLSGNRCADMTWNSSSRNFAHIFATWTIFCIE